MKMLARVATVACMVFAFASTVWWLIRLSLCVNAPLAPVAVNGQVVSFDNHGTLHYITAFQDFCLHWQIFLTIPLMVLGSWLRKRHPWPWLEQLNSRKRST